MKVLGSLILVCAAALVGIKGHEPFSGPAEQAEVCECTAFTNNECCRVRACSQLEECKCNVATDECKGKVVRRVESDKVDGVQLKDGWYVELLEYESGAVVPALKQRDVRLQWDVLDEALSGQNEIRWAQKQNQAKLEKEIEDLRLKIDETLVMIHQLHKKKFNKKNP